MQAVLQHLNLRVGVLHHIRHVIRFRLQLMQFACGLEPHPPISIGNRDLRIALDDDVDRLRITAVGVHGSCGPLCERTDVEVAREFTAEFVACTMPQTGSVAANARRPSASARSATTVLAARVLMLTSGSMLSTATSALPLPMMPSLCAAV